MDPIGCASYSRASIGPSRVTAAGPRIINSSAQRTQSFVLARHGAVVLKPSLPEVRSLIVGERGWASYSQRRRRIQPRHGAGVTPGRSGFRQDSGEPPIAPPPPQTPAPLPQHAGLASGRFDVAEQGGRPTHHDDDDVMLVKVELDGCSPFPTPVVPSYGLPRSRKLPSNRGWAFLKAPQRSETDVSMRRVHQSPLGLSSPSPPAHVHHTLFVVCGKINKATCHGGSSPNKPGRAVLTPCTTSTQFFSRLKTHLFRVHPDSA